MRRPQGQKSKKKTVTKLKCSKVADDFRKYLAIKLQDTQKHNLNNIETQWADFRDTVYATVTEHLGPITARLV